MIGLKLKKSVIYTIIFLIILIFLVIFGINKYKEYKYHKTYEYKLLNKGYTKEEVDTLLNNLKERDYLYLLKNDYNKKYVSIIDEKYYINSNFYKYINYLNEFKDLSTSEVVRNINIHLDKKFYEAEYKADISKDVGVLVNKYYLLDSSYEPNDLVVIPQTYSWGEKGSQRTRKVTYDAFLKMWNAANLEGYYLMVSSSYRSYQEQQIVYDNYKKRGQKYADKYAARPGSSEHQTGLALDIFSKTNSNKNTFKDTQTAKWLEENSWKYGFILRYPRKDEDITGYSYESWHFRYVGDTAAKYIYENNITFDLYYSYFIENKN